MTDSSSSSHPVPARRKRVRLAPDVRRQQILDVALDAFSTLGFAGTSMDRIARGVGLSKAGLYAHFASKDDIFEALLTDHLLGPPLDGVWASDPGRSLEEAVDAFLDGCYAGVNSARSLGIFRLLVAESGRAPDFMRRWHASVFAPYEERRNRAVADAVEAGLLPRNVLTENFALAMAPALMAFVGQLLLGDAAAQSRIAAIRASHREMLLILLDKERGCRP